MYTYVRITMRSKNVLCADIRGKYRMRYHLVSVVGGVVEIFETPGTEFV